jgi:hypothetical protein
VIHICTWEDVIRYATSYKTATVGAANTAVNIFTAAANTNGAVIWAATIITSAGAAVCATLLAKATAPASTIDGDVYLAAAAAAATIAASAELQNPVFVPAGLGLYHICDVLETAKPYKRVLYSLLGA